MRSNAADKDDRFGLETAYQLAGLRLEQQAEDRLLIYVDLLRRWQKAQNLVAPSTLSDLWSRHIADALQLIPLITAWAAVKELHGPNASDISLVGLDLGSGGGLPGAVLALVFGAGATNTSGGKSPASVEMSLVEANTRKCAFLRTVSRETGVQLSVRQSRIEGLHADHTLSPHFITARALAPLDKLISLSAPWLANGATAFFHKGGETDRELADWPAKDGFDVLNHSSVVDVNSHILQISAKSSRSQRRTTKG